jgi:hypothetical protein
MRNKLLPYISGLLLLAMVSSCKKFVEVNPKGALLPQTYTTYRDLLNNGDLFTASYGSNEYGTDDIDMDVPELADGMGTYVTRYQWAKVFYIDATTYDFDWNNLYKQVYTANIVINEIGNATTGTTVQKNELLGEALVHHAFAYWCLVNQYGKQYDPATAAGDLGVPLRLQSELESAFPRATVQAVYDLIVSDIKKAIPFLPAQQTVTNVYPSKSAAYAMLARTYLFMGNYPASLQYADSSLAISSNLLDLQTYSSLSAVPLTASNPEILLRKNNSAIGYYSSTRLSNDLLALLDTSDLRYTLYTDLGSNGNTYPSFANGRVYLRTSFITGESANIGLSVPEMLLTRAECQARTSDVSGAMTTLNSLRIKRFTTANYTPLTASTAAAALQDVLAERRRELMFCGMRWFDLKRLNKESAFTKILTHTLSGATYTLAPNSNNYLFPIAAGIIAMNPEITQNPRD